MELEKVTPAEAVARILAMQPDETKRPATYLDGFTLLKFGQLAAWKGYSAAREWTERLMIWQIDGEDCLLFTSFREFQEAEKMATGSTH